MIVTPTKYKSHIIKTKVNTQKKNQKSQKIPHHDTKVQKSYQKNKSQYTKKIKKTKVRKIPQNSKKISQKIPQQPKKCHKSEKKESKILSVKKI